MATLNFRVVNVFTQGDIAFTGNPLCVIEDGAGLATATMQSLARQFNLSETTFILPSDSADAKVRIFTPSFEMSFAGHPTLGTAFVCRKLGLGNEEVRLEMQVGIIPVSENQGRWTLRAASASWREVQCTRGELAGMLSLETSDIAERPLWVKAGREQLIIPLNSEAAVRRTAPDASIFQRLVNAEGQGMAYVFAPMGSSCLLGRFFFPQHASVQEDPATGSAIANLGGWMLAMRRPLPYSVQISQGEYVARPSTLHLEVNAQRDIFVGGTVIELGRGTLQL